MNKSEADAKWQKKIDEVEKKVSIDIKLMLRGKLAAMSSKGRSPLEMPVPEELNRDLERALRFRSQARKMIFECLDYIQECLTGTDRDVLKRFKKASNKIAEQTLSDFLASDDEKLLTEGFLKSIEAEFDRLFEHQRKYTTAYPPPSRKEIALYISEDVERRYPFLPRYLKALLSQNPSLLEDRGVEKKLAEISEHISRAQSIFEEIERYAVEIYIALLKTSPEAMEKFSDN